MRASCCASPRCCFPATASSFACSRRSRTIGGGVAIDTGERRYRKSDNIAARLETLSSARCRRPHRRAGRGNALRNRARRTDRAHRNDRSRPLPLPAAKAPVIALTPPYYIDRAWFQAARARASKKPCAISTPRILCSRESRCTICATTELPARRPSCWMRCWRESKDDRGRRRNRPRAGPQSCTARGRAAGARKPSSAPSKPPGSPRLPPPKRWRNRESNPRAPESCCRFCCARKSWCASPRI